MTTFSLKSFRRGLTLTAMLCLVNGAVIGGTPSIPQGDIAIDLDLVAVGLTSPISATHAGVDQPVGGWLWYI